MLPTLALCLFTAGCQGDLVVLQPGDEAPIFVLKDLQGNAVSLPEHRGRLVMIRFWADWCKSCRTEMPLIEQKYQEFKSRGLVVLALNVKQKREVALKFKRQVGISYPVLLDHDGSMARAYGVLGLPTTFLIDRNGRVMEEIIGDMNMTSLTKLIDPLFSGPSEETAGEGP